MTEDNCFGDKLTEEEVTSTSKSHFAEGFDKTIIILVFASCLVIITN